MLKVTLFSMGTCEGEKKFNDLKKLDITGVMQLNRLLSSVAAKPIRLDSGEISYYMCMGALEVELTIDCYLEYLESKLGTIQHLVAGL